MIDIVKRLLLIHFHFLKYSIHSYLGIVKSHRSARNLILPFIDYSSQQQILSDIPICWIFYSPRTVLTSMQISINPSFCIRFPQLTHLIPISFFPFLSRSGRPVLLIGKTGIGKSLLASRVLDQGIRKKKFHSTTFHFSTSTTSHQVQGLIEDNLEKRRTKGIYFFCFHLFVCLVTAFLYMYGYKQERVEI